MLRVITSVVTRSLSEEQVQEVIILPPSKSANEAGCLSGRVFVPLDFSDEVTPKLVREMKKSGLTVGVKNSPIEIAPLNGIRSTTKNEIRRRYLDIAKSKLTRIRVWKF